MHDLRRCHTFLEVGTMRFRSPLLLQAGAVAVLLCGSVPFCNAQADRGTISGTITDPGGNIIPGASVVATNLATGVQNSTVTSDVGSYVIPGLPTGSYS